MFVKQPVRTCRLKMPPTLKRNEFGGPHPSGLSGTHIHFIEPVGANKTVWTINYQDVIAIGHLFATGRLNTERVVALCGPQVNKPRLLRTVLGAKVSQITAGELVDADNRVISGSVLNGAIAQGAHDYLGTLPQSDFRYRRRPQQRAVRLGCATTGQILHHAHNPRPFLKNKLFKFNTAVNGGDRAMVTDRHLRARNALGYPAYPALARFNRRRYRQRAGFGLLGIG